MFFGLKKVLFRSQNNKILKAWKLITAFAAIVIICISIVIWAAFNIMSNSMLDHSRENAKELIKQTSKNIQTILEQMDDFAMTVSRDNKLATYVLEHDDIEDENEKKQNLMSIDKILDNYQMTREEIDYISIVTRNNTHIINGQEQKLSEAQNLFNFDIKGFREGNKKSLWLNTHEPDIDPILSNSENGKVFSIVKGIYSISSLKSQETILINIKDSYINNLIADIKFLDDSNVFIIKDNICILTVNIKNNAFYI